MKDDIYWREPCKRELPPEPKKSSKQRKPFNSWLSLFILACLLFVSQRLMFGEQQSVQPMQPMQQSEQPMQQSVQHMQQSEQPMQQVEQHMQQFEQQGSEPTAANPWAKIPAAVLPHGDAEAY